VRLGRRWHTRLRGRTRRGCAPEHGQASTQLGPGRAGGGGAGAPGCGCLGRRGAGIRLDRSENGPGVAIGAWPGIPGRPGRAGGLLSPLRQPAGTCLRRPPRRPGPHSPMIRRRAMRPSTRASGWGHPSLRFPPFIPPWRWLSPPFFLHGGSTMLLSLCPRFLRQTRGLSSTDARAIAIAPPRRTRRASSRPHCQPRLETLEDRCVLSPSVFDPNLGVRTVVSGLIQPTSMVFLGSNDFFVLEKAPAPGRTTARVEHVVNAVNAGSVLDLPVNFASERGLLGITLSPNFASDHNVYLYWTESTATDANGNRIASSDTSKVPLLGNRVDRFIWNGSTLTFDKNIIRLHAF